MEGSSAINAPHVDASPDDVTDFFGSEEELPAAEEVTIPDDPGLPDARTPEQRREDAYQYAKDHGEPITGAMEQAHQEFVGLQNQAQETPAEEEIPEPIAQQNKLREIARREAAEKEGAVSAGPGDIGKPAEGQPLPSERKSMDAGAPEKKKGGGELAREYVVFQRVPLSEKVLKHLLAQIEEGNAPEPRLAWIEVHRAEGRNANGAIAAAYTAHRDELGEKVDMAAVSSRAFQVRHVEPKQVVETNISIT